MRASASQARPSPGIGACVPDPRSAHRVQDALTACRAGVPPKQGLPFRAELEVEAPNGPVEGSEPHREGEWGQSDFGQRGRETEADAQAPFSTEGPRGPPPPIPGCTGGRGSCEGHRHTVHSPDRWPASSGREHTGHIWGPPRGADTDTAHSPHCTACPDETPGGCSHSLQEGGLLSSQDN